MTVEQVCKFLELRDYPIPASKTIQERFMEFETFENYAKPFFRRMNPKAHPLVLSTLIKAKWFEIMNTLVDDPSEKEKEENATETMDTEQSDQIKTESKIEIHQQEKPNLTLPKPKRIKLNFAIQ